MIGVIEYFKGAGKKQDFKVKVDEVSVWGVGLSLLRNTMGAWSFQVSF